MPKLKIDGIDIEVPPGTTVLQACEMLGVEVPRFCFHERLEIAGNCRMCLVEQEKAPKPIASCAMPAADNMVIHTNSPRARKARQGVMEFLLINHPLDCPICDQGGECDLQDQAMAYGFDRGRYRENKRAVKDKELGPLVKTIMTRCIHCTRCIRFATEIAGVEELGATGRGENMEVGTYVEKALTSELSGNIIDLCPVGALTSKPYAFTARSWELRKTESVDVLDAVGCSIRVDSRGPQVMRVLPRLNEAVNEEWISDKTRFAYDGLTRQRLDRPYVRRDGKLAPATWAEAFGEIARRMEGLAGTQMAAIAGDLADAESMYALRALMDALGSPNRDCRQDGAAIDPAVRASYLFNTTIAGIEAADVCLLVGTNPRWEAPLVNARLRKRWRRGGFEALRLGPEMPLTYDVTELGNDPAALGAIADGSHAAAERLKAAKAPMLIVGMGALARPDGAAVLAAARRVAEACGMVRDGWNGFNVLHTAAARVGGLEAGFVPGAGGRDVAGILGGAASGEIGLVWLLGADEIDMQRLGRAFVVYQGHHGDAGAHRADVILPGAAYTEKDGLYVNMEGRVQEGRRAVFPPGEAREDWKIIRAFSAVIGRPLPFDDLAAVRAALAAAAPLFATRETPAAAGWAAFGAPGPIAAHPFRSPVDDFYMTDAICRASITMAECSELYVRGGVAAHTGTHG
ncbi:MAG: NADH-quinone oxidoreductase subunit G [Alphaproteobacteria bacterium]|nr:NADH-quinone oxidoreductase subunit G [Alphaproteobacteria bacterium]